MVLGTEVHELSCDVPQTLSPEQIARATLKNSELDQSLGISPTQHLHEDPNPDEGLKLGVSQEFTQDDLCNVQPKKLSFEIEVVKSPETDEQLAPEDDNEKFIAEVAASLEHDNDVARDEELVEDGCTMMCATEFLF